jgi:hypothetical protein
MTTPKYLYHGTSVRNARRINKIGLKPNIGHTSYTKSSGFGGDVGVSLARSEGSAIFFSAASQSHKKGVPSQAIIKVDTAKLDRHLLFPRTLFGKANGEYDYCKTIPPSAFVHTKVREFHKDEKGKLKSKERYL